MKHRHLLLLFIFSFLTIGFNAVFADNYNIFKPTVGQLQRLIEIQDVGAIDKIYVDKNDNVFFTTNSHFSNLILDANANGNSSSFVSLADLNATRVFQGNSQDVNTITDLGTSGVSIASKSGNIANFLKLISSNSQCLFTSNSTNDILTCTPFAGVNSLNFTTNGDFDFTMTPKNMSQIQLVGQVFVFTLKNNHVLTNGSAQEVTKPLTLDQLIFGGKVTGNNQNMTGVNNINATKIFQGLNQVFDTISNLGTSGISLVSKSANTIDILKLISANNNCLFSTNSTNGILNCFNTAQLTNLFSTNGAGNGISASRSNATNNNVKSLTCSGTNTCSNNSTNINILGNSKYVLLDTHKATTTENTYTFTPAAALTNATYSHIAFEITGVASATLAVQLQVDGDISSNYNMQGLRSSAGTAAGVNGAAQAQMQLCSSTLISATGDFTVHGTIFIPTSTTQHITGTAECYDTVSNIVEKWGWGLNAAHATITSITYKTSTSTWTSGTKILTYGVQD